MDYVFSCDHDPEGHAARSDHDAGDTQANLTITLWHTQSQRDFAEKENGTQRLSKKNKHVGGTRAGLAAVTNKPEPVSGLTPLQPPVSFSLVCQSSVNFRAWPHIFQAEEEER